MKRHHSELGSSSSSSPTTNANTVKEGDTVILSFKDKSFFAYVSSSTTLGKTKIGKANVSTRPLLNLPYGSVVELQNKKTFFHTEDDEISPEVYDFDFDSSQAKDNRNLLSSKLGNDSQNLSGEDITKLQQSGSSGGDIISKLIENSSTFAGKTEFSKAKYIAKKQLKYQPRARIIRCLASTICSVMFGRNPGKIMNIREDTLAQVLTYGNVFAGMKCIVFDQAAGMVAGAVCERMGGFGRMLNIYVSQDPGHAEMLKKFNFSHRTQDVIKYVSGYEIFNDKLGENHASSEPADAEQKQMLAKGWPVPLQEHTVEHLQSMKDDEERLNFLQKRAGRFLRKLTRPSVSETNEWLAEGSDSLIIACKFDACKVLKKLWPFLNNSCPFVIYSEHIQTLVVAMKMLQDEKNAVKLSLSETWLREIQVLENRTHPVMNMSHSGGFLLSGIKVGNEVVKVEQKGKFVGAGMAAYVYSGRKSNKKGKKIVEELKT